MLILKYQNTNGSTLALREEDKMNPGTAIALIQKTKDKDTRKKIGAAIGIPVASIFMFLIAISSLSTSSGTAAEPLSEQVEAYRPMVSNYCSKYKIGEYTDLALALMMAESGGTEPDPMQAAEGVYGLYCLKTKNKSGGHHQGPNGIPTGHSECSINAGVQELRDALKAAEVESPYDLDRIKTAVQGYNYGMTRWIKWIKAHGGRYTLALSKEYSATMMPTGAKGTPNHAEKVMRYYSIATGDSSAEILLLAGNAGLQVTYYNQGDAAWASLPYGSSTIKKSGCGPTSAAICISTLSGKRVTPRQTCTWAAQNGYYVSGAGSKHEVIPALAKHYGLKCKGVGKDKEKVVKALKSGKLVVAIMGPTHFTSGGHFIVLRGIKNGKILVADCGSRERTKETWSLDLIASEAKGTASAGGPFWIISK